MISIEMSSSMPTAGPEATPENSTSSWSSESEAKETGVSERTSCRCLALSKKRMGYEGLVMQRWR